MVRYMPNWNESHFGNFSSRPQVVFPHGVDSTGASRALLTDTAGHMESLLVDAAGGVIGSVANPLNARLTHTALAPGGSTAARQDLMITALQLLDDTIAGSESQVDVITSALPAGAATEAKQDAQETTLDAIQTAVEGTLAVSGTFWQATQPVSGTVTANLSATDNAVLDAIVVDTTSLDGKVTACDTGAVVISSGTVTANLSAVDNAVLDVIASDTTSIDGKITACDTGSVVVSSSALPTGASTAANQSTGNASLATLASAVAGSEMQVDLVAAPDLEVKATHTSGQYLATATSVGDDAYASELNVSSYKTLRLYGKCDSATAFSFPMMGSQTSGGTFYMLEASEVLQVTTVEIGGVPEFHVSCKIENCPPYVKFYNNSGASVIFEIDYTAYSN